MTNAPVQTLYGLQERLNALHDTSGLSWRQIAARDEYEGVSHGTLRAIAVDGRDPRDPRQRRMLGLPPRAVPVVPCAECGRVHTQYKQCDHRPPPVDKKRFSFWVDAADIERLREIADGHPGGQTGHNAAREGIEVEAEQMYLITGFYRCDDCGKTCDRLRKTKRFRLCDACWERVMSGMPKEGMVLDGSPEQETIAQFAKWREEIERRVPPRRTAGHIVRTRLLRDIPPMADEYYPLCACGGQRRKRMHGLWSNQSGLFGGPYFDLCPVCDAKRQVDNYVKMAGYLHREWDDEEWLDILWKAIPDAFDLGVLPKYWFELRLASTLGNATHTRVKFHQLPP